MALSWWQNLIVTFLPMIVQLIESETGVAPNPNDASWVKGLIAEVVSLVQKWIPAWALPAVEDVEAFVAAEVEKLLGQSS